jgi:uracil-DNA glycosylase
MKKTLFWNFFNLRDSHESWLPFFDGNAQQLKAIAETLLSNKQFTPSADKVFSFAKTPVTNIRVVILGQDPYPQINAATGLAFECGLINDWNEPFRQSSLKNILRSIYSAYYGKTAKWTELRDIIQQGGFKIAPPNIIFEHWRDQGVLLLNTSLTCDVGASASHRVLWEGFAVSIINFLNLKNTAADWFLWGNHARELKPYIQSNKIYESRHPMLCNINIANDFLNCPCFKETLDVIDWMGTEIAE